MSEKEIIEKPQPIQPAERKPANWPKVVLAVLLGLGLLVSAVYAGYWYGAQGVQQGVQVEKPTPTPDQQYGVIKVRRWRTYTNAVHDFTLNYPSDFYVQIEGSDVELEPGEVKIAVRLTKSDDTNYPVVDVSVTKTHLTPEQWIKAHRCGSPLSTTTLCSLIGPGMVPGSLQVQSTEEVHYQSVDTVLKRDNLLFDITIGATSPKVGITDDALATYNRILTTFEFLN